MNNVALFEDTQKRIRNDNRLLQLTDWAVNNTYIIEEGFYSDKHPFFSASKVFFEENLTLIPAYRLYDAGEKTAVLNFANPVEPGGGVLRGANAQEEYLCRAGNLYNSLNSKQALSYYSRHREIWRKNGLDGVFLGSDRIIYSPRVTFFREDRGYLPDDRECHFVQDYTNRWRAIDVITCAAPYFQSHENVLPIEELFHLFCRRIRNILEAAIDNDVKILILGAFGCGAFHNPPLTVADAFRTVLLQRRYMNAFREVVFAVKRSERFSENIEAFQTDFNLFPYIDVFSEERNKRRFFE